MVGNGSQQKNNAVLKKKKGDVIWSPQQGSPHPEVRTQSASGDYNSIYSGLRNRIAVICQQCLPNEFILPAFLDIQAALFLKGAVNTVFVRQQRGIPIYPP